MLDSLFVVLDERLVEQGDFFKKFLHAAFDALFHNLFRLHGLAGRRCHSGVFRRLGCSNRALAFDQFGRHLIGRQGNRLHCGHMHSHILGRRMVAFEGHQHTNAGAVQIRSDMRASGRAIETPESHVFANLADQAFADIFQSRAEAILGIRQSRQGCNINRVVLCHQRRSRIGQCQKAVVFGDEIGLAIDFQHGAGIRAGTQHNDAFSSNPSCRFTRFAAQLDAQNLFRSNHIAFGLGQRFFAFHHGGIRLAAQFSDHGSGNRSHITLSVIKLCSKTKKKGPASPLGQRQRP